jgi:hypothetical protein
VEEALDVVVAMLHVLVEVEAEDVDSLHLAIFVVVQLIQVVVVEEDVVVELEEKELL